LPLLKFQPSYVYTRIYELCREVQSVPPFTKSCNRHSAFNYQCRQTVLGDIYYMILYDMIYLTAIGLPPGGSSTVHIYTQTIPRTTQSTQTIHRTTQFIN